MEVNSKVVGVLATLLAGGSLSGWSVAITKSGDVTAAKADTATERGRFEEQRASFAYARQEGLLLTLDELREECAKRCTCESG